MRTRHMNERITIFVYEDMQNENGELIEGVRQDLFSCWCEVSKATVKEFKERSNGGKNGELLKRRDTKNFFIRYQQETEIDSSMMIDFKGKEYRILDIESDDMRHDFSMVKAEVVE